MNRNQFVFVVFVVLAMLALVAIACRAQEATEVFPDAPSQSRALTVAADGRPAQAATNVPPGALPYVPVRSRVLTTDFFVGEAVMWGGIAADGLESARSINHRRCTYETNPLFRGNDGTFKTAKYFAINAGVGGFFTVIDVLVRKYAGTRKAVRVFGTAMTASDGVPHWIAFAEFYATPGCH